MWLVRTMGRPELGRAIASVLGQSWPNVEIVMVVANPEFFPRTEFAHPGIKIVKPGIPLLRPAAGNAGLEAATGEWIGFLDEDDIHEPHHAKTLVEAALASGALFAYGDLIVHEGDKPSYVRTGTRRLSRRALTR